MYLCGCMRERQKKRTRRRGKRLLELLLLEHTVMLTTPTYSSQWHTLGGTSWRMLSCEILVLLLNFYTHTHKCIYIYKYKYIQRMPSYDACTQHPSSCTEEELSCNREDVDCPPHAGLNCVLSAAPATCSLPHRRPVLSDQLVPITE